MPFRPIKTTDDTLCCVHWRTWPPMKALEFDGKTALDLYQEGELDGVEFQRFQIWERDCGLVAMAEGTCRECSHVRRVEIRPPAVPTLVTMDGKTKTPILDRTFVSQLPSFRSNIMTAHRPDGTRGARRDSAWVRNVQEEAKDE